MDKQFLITCQDVTWHLENHLHLLSLCSELLTKDATPTPETVSRLELLLDAYQTSVRQQLANFSKAICTQRTGE